MVQARDALHPGRMAAGDGFRPQMSPTGGERVRWPRVGAAVGEAASALPARRLPQNESSIGLAELAAALRALLSELGQESRNRGRVLAVEGGRSGRRRGPGQTRYAAGRPREPEGELIVLRDLDPGSVLGEIACTWIVNRAPPACAPRRLAASPGAGRAFRKLVRGAPADSGSAAAAASADREEPDRTSLPDPSPGDRRPR